MLRIALACTALVYLSACSGSYTGPQGRIEAECAQMAQQDTSGPGWFFPIMEFAYKENLKNNCMRAKGVGT